MEAPGRRRYRLAGYTMLASFGHRGMSMLVMVLTVSLTIPYLGAERFGVWMTIASLAAILSFMDLGVGNALTNSISRAAESGAPGRLLEAVSGGLGFLFLLACLSGLLLGVAAEFLPLERLIKTSGEELDQELRAAVRAFVVLFSAALFATGISRVFYGLQRGFEAHAAGILGSLLSLGLLWLAASREAGIPWLLASAMVGPIVGNLALLIILARRGQFRLAAVAAQTRHESRELFSVGGYFFLLQIAAMVSWGSDSLIIATVAGASYVAVFSVCQRLFQFVSQPLMVVNAALWPAYANAHNCDDRSFIRHTLQRSLVGSLLFWAALSAVLVGFGPQLVTYWTDGVIDVSRGLLAVFAVWILCDVVANAFAMFLNGCNLLRIQVISAFSLMLFALPLKIFLMSQYDLGTMLAGFAALFALNFVIWYGLVFRRMIFAALRPVDA